MVLLTALLLVGFRSRPSSACAAGLLLWQAHTERFPEPTVALVMSVVGVAVVLLGPGALSLDAHLFGPREIVVPLSSQRGGDQ
jgi:uncharacterized membrane protein YphA (DoxX/SURF4 family)